MTGTTDEQIKESYANRSTDEVEKFDEWVKENGGTIQYGKLINEVSKLGPLSEHGLMEHDWDIEKEEVGPDAEVIDSWDGLLDSLQDSDDDCETEKENRDDPECETDSGSDWDPETDHDSEEDSEDLDYDEFVSEEDLPFDDGNKEDSDSE